MTNTPLDPSALAHALGDELPTPLHGESATEHRQRVLGTFQRHSPDWSAVNLRRLKGAALDTAERQIYAAANAAARDPGTVPAGTLREIVETDPTGRRITRFIGDPEACWGPFKSPSRIVTAWHGAPVPKPGKR